VPMVELTGLSVFMDVTPRWWKDGTVRRSQILPTLGPVLAAAMAELKFATAISYDVRKGAIELTALVPRDVTLEALERRREEVLDKLDALKPTP